MSLLACQIKPPVVRAYGSLTAGVNSHLAVGDIRGDTEVRQPQVLNLPVLEYILNSRVELVT